MSKRCGVSSVFALPPSSAPPHSTALSIPPEMFRLELAGYSLESKQRSGETPALSVGETHFWAAQLVNIRHYLNCHCAATKDCITVCSPVTTN